MSGAEAALIVGLISSTWTIFEAAYQIYAAAHDAKGLPQAFREAADQIPLVLHILSLVESSLSERPVSPQVIASVRPILERCKDKATLIKGIFGKVSPSQDASWVDRYKKATEAKVKESEVSKSMEAVMKDLALLQHHRVFQNAQTMEDIKQAIDRLPSLSDQGSGHLGRHTTFGAQQNHVHSNSGSGDFYQSNNMTFYKGKLDLDIKRSLRVHGATVCYCGNGRSQIWREGT